MASDMSFFQNLSNDKILNMHTAYIGRVEQIKGNTAMVMPLVEYKAVGGESSEKSLKPAFIPPNIKYKAEELTYQKTLDEQATITVLVPDSLAIGDTVYVGVCDRDITYAKNGRLTKATNRHHNINDGVVLYAW